MSQPDEYAREVLRDAIPLLEQLLERLRVLAGPKTKWANLPTSDDQPSHEC